MPVPENAPVRFLRVVVVDADAAQSKFYRDFLPTQGHAVVAAFPTGQDLVAWSRGVRFDLLITEVNLPDMDGLAAAIAVARANPVPVILVSACYDRGVLERALADHVLTCLCKPVNPVELAANVVLARRRFEQLLESRREAAETLQSLQERKLVERAKGVLMRRAELDEEGAYRRLQRLASDNNIKMVEAARTLLTAEEAFGPPRGGHTSGRGGSTLDDGSNSRRGPAAMDPDKRREVARRGGEPSGRSEEGCGQGGNEGRGGSDEPRARAGLANVPQAGPAG